MTKRLSVILLLCVAGIAACVPAPNLLDETLLHDTSLVSSDPCGPPCFRGIVPGETSWNEAVTILEDASDFTNVQTETAEGENESITVATWQEGDEGQVCCQIHSDEGNSEVVAVTFLRTAPDMTLGQLIDAHGEPPYLTGQEFTEDQAIGSMIYPELQMVVYVFVEGMETGAFSASSQIIGVLYMTADEMDELLRTAELHTWEGYQPLTSYLEGDLELTPSVTLTPTPGS